MKEITVRRGRHYDRTPPKQTAGLLGFLEALFAPRGRVSKHGGAGKVSKHRGAHKRVVVLGRNCANRDRQFANKRMHRGKMRYLL